MRSRCVLVTLARSTPALAIFLTAVSTSANSFGIAGFSGKRGFICDTCHRGGSPPGATPAVEFEAPGGTTVAAGAIATFRFRIASTAANRQTHAGFNVAASDGVIGVTDPAGTLTQVVLGSVEITHSSPRANDPQGVAVFEFSWRAPEAAGTYTLFGAGNSVNRDGTIFGDAAARTTLSITVIAPSTPTPTQTATPTAVSTATPAAVSTATATPTSTTTPTSTASSTPGEPCVGDCNGDGLVTVDEIVSGVAMALGNLAVEECPSFDRDRSATVTVDELVEAIQKALNGC